MRKVKGLIISIILRTLNELLTISFSKCTLMYIMWSYQVLNCPHISNMCIYQIQFQITLYKYLCIHVCILSTNSCNVHHMLFWIFVWDISTPGHEYTCQTMHGQSVRNLLSKLVQQKYLSHLTCTTIPTVRCHKYVVFSLVCDFQTWSILEVGIRLV